jgi:threonine aldolase
MADAEVGDDVFGEDPSVRALEEEVAAISGKEASLFVPSGTMGNQLAIACQTRPGDEVIIGEGAHVAFYEVGAGAALSGVQFVVAGRGGFFTAAELLEQVKPEAYFYPRTALVALENTHNRAGGAVLSEPDSRKLAETARERGLRVHLDGARIWNASVATGVAVATFAAPFDTISVCFSKGLGAPVGSALAGTREVVERARRFRKMWGAGMRQAGIIAAGARYALRHHRERLADDHANAKTFAEALANAPGVHVDLAKVTTNIVNVTLTRGVRAAEFASASRAAGVLLNVVAPDRVRVVTHLDVSREEVVEAAARLTQALRRGIPTERG